MCLHTALSECPTQPFLSGNSDPLHAARCEQVESQETPGRKLCLYINTHICKKKDFITQILTFTPQALIMALLVAKLQGSKTKPVRGGCVCRPVSAHVHVLCGHTRVCTRACILTGPSCVSREALVPQEKPWVWRGCKEALLQSLGWFVAVCRVGWAGGWGRRDGSNWPHERR